jgi:hypothetical protein
MSSSVFSWSGSDGNRVSLYTYATPLSLLGHRVVLRSDVEQYKAGHVAVISGGGVFLPLDGDMSLCFQTHSLQSTTNVAAAVPVLSVEGATDLIYTC